MRDRLRQLIRLVGAIAVTVGVAAGASAAALYLTGSNGPISCVSPTQLENPEPIQRWAIAAGVPALVAFLVGAFFALAAARVLWRLVALVLVVALAAATFYAVYTLLPANCRP
jgi:hypothetical protein